MKAEVLAKILMKNPTADVRISVKDYYSTYGKKAKLFECNPDTDSLWNGYTLNKDSNWLTISVSLEKEDGKNSKITFRS